MQSTISISSRDVRIITMACITCFTPRGKNQKTGKYSASALRHHQTQFTGTNTKALLLSLMAAGTNGGDCRDMMVVRDVSTGNFHGFFTARIPAQDLVETAVIAHATSNDLIRWEQGPPVFATFGIWDTRRA